MWSLKLCDKWIFILLTYKQLGSDLSYQSCLYFHIFGGSQLLNGCFAVWPSNLMAALNTVIFRIQNQYLLSVVLSFSQKCIWVSSIMVHCVQLLIKKTKSNIVADIDSNLFDECAAECVCLGPQEEEWTSSSWGNSKCTHLAL